MPIYEYHCDKCNNEFELMEPFDSAHEKKCGACGSMAKRKISSSAFHLKGSGWYTSDYKKAEKKPACEAAKSDSPACAACAAGGEKS